MAEELNITPRDIYFSVTLKLLQTPNLPAGNLTLARKDISCTYVNERDKKKSGLPRPMAHNSLNVLN